MWSFCFMGYQICQPPHRLHVDIRVAVHYVMASPTAISTQRKYGKITIKQEDRRQQEVIMLAGIEHGAYIWHRIRCACTVSRRGSSQQRMRLTTSFRIVEINRCSGIPTTGNRCASHATTPRQRKKMAGSGVTNLDDMLYPVGYAIKFLWDSTG